MANTGRRVVSLALAASLVWAPGVRAGDLNTEMNSLIDNLGGVGNYTAPGAFRGQGMNTFSGGSLMARIPNKRYQLYAIDKPSIHAGCNGIDINGGSISLMDKDQFVDTLKSFRSSLKGVAFQLALKAVSPLFAGVTEYFKDLDSKLSISSKSSCELANMAASNLGDLTGWNVDRACVAAAQILHSETEIEATRRCHADRASVMNEIKASSDPDIAALAPFTGNLTWAALKKGDNANLDDDDRELIMSMIGTVVYDPDSAIPSQSHQATITTAAQLLYGESKDSTNPDNSFVTLLKCDTKDECKAPHPEKVSIQTMSTRVRKLMESIVQHIRTKTSFKNADKEVVFINSVDEPVYRMMAIATSTKDDSFATSLMARYGDAVAADFASAILARSIRVGIHALSINSKLNPAQQKDAQILQSTAQGMLAVLAMEKNTTYAKVSGIESMTRDLERLQMSLRTNSANKVLSLLGQQASLN